MAGPELHQECMTLEGCRTGEAKLSKGYGLAAAHVIHTVGPRYNVKYRTAAENALHSCYRNVLQVAKENKIRAVAFCCVNSERKGYPPEDAVHIALRTVRRFLERWGPDIDRIVFAVDAKNVEAYRTALPLYFPRSDEEELAARELLPEDTGNELGETVSEERKIRISEFPRPPPQTALPTQATADASG